MITITKEEAGMCDTCRRRIGKPPYQTTGRINRETRQYEKVFLEPDCNGNRDCHILRATDCDDCYLNLMPYCERRAKNPRECDGSTRRVYYEKDGSPTWVGISDFRKNNPMIFVEGADGKIKMYMKE